MKKPTKSLRILDEISNELQKVRSPSIGKHSKRMSRSPYILSPSIKRSIGGSQIGLKGSTHYKHISELQNSPFRGFNPERSGDTANFHKSSQQFRGSGIGAGGIYNSASPKENLMNSLSRNTNQLASTLSYPPVYPLPGNPPQTRENINIGLKSENLYLKITENIGDLMKLLENSCNQLDEKIAYVLKAGVKEKRFLQDEEEEGETDD